MTPTNKDNFVIEVTSEVMAEINRLWMNAEEEAVAELHYSPYWEEKPNEYI
jgi:hypothetical protein